MSYCLSIDGKRTIVETNDIASTAQMEVKETPEEIDKLIEAVK